LLLVSEAALPLVSETALPLVPETTLLRLAEAARLQSAEAALRKGPCPGPGTSRKPHFLDRLGGRIAVGVSEIALPLVSETALPLVPRPHFRWSLARRKAAERRWSQSAGLRKEKSANRARCCSGARCSAVSEGKRSASLSAGPARRTARAGTRDIVMVHVLVPGVRIVITQPPPHCLRGERNGPVASFFWGFRLAFRPIACKAAWMCLVVLHAVMLGAPPLQHPL
jgi:hypothetical protein